nr:endonuclease NucS domain-containing protein [Halobacillus sp. A1]
MEITEWLLFKLSKRTNLNPKQDPLAAKSSALRDWKLLNNDDVTFLFDLIDNNEQEGRLVNDAISTTEIFEILERDIEKFILNDPSVLGEGLQLKKSQYFFADGSRLDLLLYQPDEEKWIVVEVKKDKVGRQAKNQIKHYMKLCNKELG